MQRLLEALGEAVGQDELFALSGVGLCFPWRCGSCCDEVGIIPEIPARTLGAFGYESAYLTGEALADKAAAAAKIRASIAAGRPVIGFGVTVSAPMACLIVGCGKDGLYVRACQPPEGGEAGQAEPYFVADWHEKCAGLLFAGEKTGERLTGEAAYARDCGLGSPVPRLRSARDGGGAGRLRRAGGVRTDDRLAAGRRTVAVAE